MRNVWIVLWVMVLPCAVNAFVTERARKSSILLPPRYAPISLSSLHLTKEEQPTIQITSLSKRQRSFNRIRSFLRQPFASSSSSSSPPTTKKNKLHMGAIFLATLLFRPLKAFAGGASFGGSKASAVPLQRLVQGCL